MPPKKELKHAATKERAITTTKHKRKQTREKKSEQIFVGHTEKKFLNGRSIFLSVTTLNVNSTVLRGNL